MFSSHGTVNSTKIICFVESEYIIISGRSLEVVICAGNFNCFPRSTLICQSEADDIIDWATFGFSVAVVLGLTNYLIYRGQSYFKLLPGTNLFLCKASVIIRAVASSTLSCRQR